MLALGAGHLEGAQYWQKFLHRSYLQKQVALFSMRMQQTNSQRPGIFAIGRNPPSKPVLASTWVAGIAVETPGSQM